LTFGWSPTLRATVTIGFIGGFTTYSSFNYETIRLIEEGAGLAALANITATVIGGLAAGWLGLVLARELLPR
jgi:CrcB protein